jgi:hypothetical protein
VHLRAVALDPDGAVGERRRRLDAAEAEDRPEVRAGVDPLARDLD